MDLTELIQQFQELSRLFYEHTHKGFDRSKQLPPVVFPTQVGKSYPGVVLSGGTAGTPFPSGWSITHIGTGDYKITHNLNSGSYAIVPVLFASTNLFININNQNVNDVEVFIKNAAGTATDATFHFILVTP